MFNNLPVLASHIFTVLSLLAVTTLELSELNSDDLTILVWPSKVIILLFDISHIFAVSPIAVTVILLPSELNLANALASDNVFNKLPLDVSHTLTVLSTDADKTFVLSELNSTDKIKSVCPDSENNILPLDESHIFAVLSLEPVTTLVPSELNSAILTQSVWPTKSNNILPLDESHIFAVLS